MPSGIVTYAAAIGNVSTLVFSIASTLGKIPALIIEVLVSVAIIEVAQSQELNILITKTNEYLQKILSLYYSSVR